MKRKTGLATLSPLAATNGARVAIYVRVSSAMQVEDGFSLEAQLKACQKFAADRGWQVVEVFEEPGVSGKDDNRPAFQRMIRAAEAGRFNVILTHKLDRFSRSILDVLTYLRDLNEWGIAYVSATENFDFSTPMGKMQLHIMAALAQWYLDNLSQEITKGKKARAEAGYWNGNLPFGYRAGDARTIEVNEHEAQGVRMAFQLAVTGAHSYVQIAKALNEAGYRTRGQGKFSKGQFTKYTARDLLHNKFYLGYAKYRQAAAVHRRFDYFEGQHPALIDQDTWDRAQKAIRSEVTRRTRAKPDNRIYPLTGLAVCADCGSPYRGQSARQITYYMDTGRTYGKDCPPTLIRTGELDEALVSFFEDVEITDQVRNGIINRVKRQERANHPDENKRAALLARLDRNKRLFQMGDLTEAEYLKERHEIEDTLNNLRPVPTTKYDIEAAAQFLTTFGRLIRQATPQEQKDFFRTVLNQVVIKSKKIIGIRPKPNYYDLLLFVCSAPEWI